MKQKVRVIERTSLVKLESRSIVFANIVKLEKSGSPPQIIHVNLLS